MSISIVHHVREKSQAKGSARALLLNLAIYANDCCGVAWPSDATLYHEANVSRQRVHELKNALEQKGELVTLERPGATNLYCVAWQGKPLGGTSAEAPTVHDFRCPLRDPAVWDRCTRLWPDRYLSPAGVRGVSEISDPCVSAGGSEFSAGGSDFSDRGSLNSLTQKQLKTREKNDAPAAPIAHAHHGKETSPPPHAMRMPDKPEEASPFWCPACGYAIPSCAHRVLMGVPSARPGGPLTLVMQGRGGRET